MNTEEANAAYLAVIERRAIKILDSDCLDLGSAAEAISASIKDLTKSIAERVAFATIILRIAKQPLPDSIRIEKGADIAKPERDEWLVLTYATTSVAPRPTIRNARTSDFRRGRLAPTIPR